MIPLGVAIAMILAAMLLGGIVGAGIVMLVTDRAAR